MSLTPRQIRVVRALLRGPQMRETLDAIAGASNGPGVVMQLRIKGISIDCERIDSTDRDGRPCRPGRYSLTRSGRMVAKLILKKSLKA